MKNLIICLIAVCNILLLNGCSKETTEGGRPISMKWERKSDNIEVEEFPGSCNITVNGNQGEIIFTCKEDIKNLGTYGIKLIDKDLNLISSSSNYQRYEFKNDWIEVVIEKKTVKIKFPPVEEISMDNDLNIELGHEYFSYYAFKIKRKF